MTGRELRDEWVRLYREHPDADPIAEVDLDDVPMMATWDALAAKLKRLGLMEPLPPEDDTFELPDPIV